MEPRQHETPNIGERPYSGAANSEFAVSPDRLSSSPENEGERAPEIGSAHAEAVQVAMPSLPAATSSAPTQTQSDDATPLIADDDDLIEKEWVDKAKQIIANTKDDPYRREREISKLQIEYIRKRYGRVIGDSGE